MKVPSPGGSEGAVLPQRLEQQYKAMGSSLTGLGSRNGKTCLDHNHSGCVAKICDEGHLRGGVSFLHPLRLTLADHAHRVITLLLSLCCLE